MERLGMQPLFIEPGSSWENACNKSFNGKRSDELLSGEIFTTLLEAQVLVEPWRETYNRVRPHSSLGYRPPVRKRSNHRHGQWHPGSVIPSITGGRSGVNQ
jgi:putative transposase